MNVFDRHETPSKGIRMMAYPVQGTTTKRVVRGSIFRVERGVPFARQGNATQRYAAPSSVKGPLNLVFSTPQFAAQPVNTSSPNVAEVPYDSTNHSVTLPSGSNGGRIQK